MFLALFISNLKLYLLKVSLHSAEVGISFILFEMNDFSPYIKKTAS